MRNVVLLSVSVGLATVGCGSDGAKEPTSPTQGSAQKPGAHFVGEPDCDVVGGNLVCTGTVAGLGNQAVFVDVTATQVCTNRGGNEPPGQIRGTSEEIDPEQGRIDFTVSAQETCPGPQTASFGETALITITTANTNEIVFEGEIPID